MEKWDQLIVILKDNQLEDLLVTIYQLTSDTDNMKQNIQEAAD